LRRREFVIQKAPCSTSIGAFITASEQVLLDFDEDALSGAFLSGFDDTFELAVREVRETGCATRIGEHLGALLDVGEAIVEQRENVGGDLLTESVARAEILIDPDLHTLKNLFVRGMGS
jgi:hypothetical protein